jgi:hypothetical protein
VLDVLICLCLYLLIRLARLNVDEDSDVKDDLRVESLRLGWIGGGCWRSLNTEYL